MTVYELKCDDCPAKHVGQTSRYLSIGVNELRRDQLFEKDSSVIVRHCLENGHSFNFNQTKILAVENKLIVSRDDEKYEH